MSVWEWMPCRRRLRSQTNEQLHGTHWGKRNDDDDDDNGDGKVNDSQGDCPLFRSTQHVPLHFKRTFKMHFHTLKLRQFSAENLIWITWIFDRCAATAFRLNWNIYWTRETRARERQCAVRTQFDCIANTLCRREFSRAPSLSLSLSFAG